MFSIQTHTISHHYAFCVLFDIGRTSTSFLRQLMFTPHARFLKAGMNIVDLLGILPYFASLILSLVMTATARGRETANYQASYRDSSTALCVLYP